MVVGSVGEVICILLHGAWPVPGIALSPYGLPLNPEVKTNSGDDEEFDKGRRELVSVNIINQVSFSTT